MKSFQQARLPLIIALSIFVSSCGPNDDKGSMDQKNSSGEGAVDSTKIPNFDSSHAFLPVPGSLIHYVNCDTDELHLKNHSKNL